MKSALVNDVEKIADSDDVDAAEAISDHTEADAATESDSLNDVVGEANKRFRQVSISLRSLAVTVITVGLIAAVSVMTWLYLGAKHELAEQATKLGNTSHAEQVALDYAVNAAVMSYKDLGPWKQNIVKGTTPELADKLTKAAGAMEQIVMPLQWSSTAKPLAAKLRSENKGVYIVDAFVSVMTKTVQSPDELQSTATYAVTVDSNNAWKISDVGGIAAVVAK
jgi:Mce-associated membrane protein